MPGIITVQNVLMKDENGYCKAAGVLCPYQLHCNECDVHNSINRAISLAERNKIKKLEDNEK